MAARAHRRLWRAVLGGGVVVSTVAGGLWSTPAGAAAVTAAPVTAPSVTAPSGTAPAAAPAGRPAILGAVRPATAALRANLPMASGVDGNAATAPGGSTIGPVTGSAPPLVYQGGTVMGTGTGPTVLHPVYWTPPGTSFPAGYEATVDRFLADLAASSGATTNVLSVASQYYQQGIGGADQHIADDWAVAPPTVDTDPLPTRPLPTGACTPDPGTAFTACLDAAQLSSELTAIAGRDGFTGGMSDQYLLLLPPPVETCDGSSDAAAGGSCDSGTSAAAYCAWHSWANLGSATLVFSDLQYPGPWCTAQPASTGTAAASTGMVTTLVHEVVESETDPLGNAWYDSAGNEIGDECDWETAPQVFGLEQWDVQRMFSNADWAAAPAGGCAVADGAPTPAVSAVAPASGEAGAAATVTLSGTALGGVTDVLVGGVPATHLVHLADGQLTVTVPPRRPGLDAVSVVGPGGTSAAAPAAQYRYLAPTVHASSRTGSGDVTVWGSATPGTRIRLSARVAGGQPRAVATLTAGAAGEWRLVVPVVRTTKFWVIADGFDSGVAVARVGVAVRLGLRRTAGGVRVTVSTDPAVTGVEATVVTAAGSPAVLGRLPLRAPDGVAVATWRLRSGLRVVVRVPAGDGAAGGSSGVAVVP